jgi:hypothetical protein
VNCSQGNRRPGICILGLELQNPTVRTRMQEMVSCCVAVSNKPDPLKNVLPKKPSACARRPNCFHLALYERRYCAKPDKPKPAHI